MSDNKQTIGGYFELELSQRKHYHDGALRLNTARNCFEYILLARNYKKVYIPFYTCEVMLQPLHKHNIAYQFYSIDKNLEPVSIVKLKKDEAFLYTNYFGIKQMMVEYLANFYGNQLIVDNAQAFFSPHIEGIDTFYSPRKFFGVPDGAYLYTDVFIDDDIPQDVSIDRMSHLLKRIDVSPEDGYVDFKNEDSVLDNMPILRMSKLSESILASIEYDVIKLKRRDNFIYLHSKLGDSNLLKVSVDDGMVPMVYPYLQSSTSLRQKLQEYRIYVARYWPNVEKWCNEHDLEVKYMNQLFPLPIDQRYGQNEMDRIVKLIRI